VESWPERGERVLSQMKEQQEMDSRDERSLKRATIVEKWWCGKINKVVKQYEKLQKEVEPREIEEGQMEELRNIRRQERLASQRLNEKEAQRERSSQEGGQEEEGVEAWEKDVSMDIEEEREYSASMPGNIGNLAKETAPEDENETP
jgi:hypothetical protein